MWFKETYCLNYLIIKLFELKLIILGFYYFVFK